MSNVIKAIVKSAGSKVMAKSNGAQYVLINAEITEGPAKGLIVLATRTTLTKDAVIKEIPAINAEVVLYHTVVPSTKEGEKNQHFFEIGLGGETANNTELDKVFGL
jgi:archaellum component FlaG (FlaF/FlaG flagellin family)